jgi:YD repeat-containing protein
VAFVDPWGNRSRVEYDPYALLVTATYDALPAPLTNVVQARTHYRTLQPWQVIDPNGNRNAVRFDALGMITATAVMGKPGAGEGDSLDETTIEESAADDPTSRLSYDRSPDRRRPCYVRTEVREEHVAAGAMPWWRHQPDDSGALHLRRPTNLPATRNHALADLLSYSTALTGARKIQAEPGLAPMRDSVGNLVRDTDGKPVLQYTATRWVGTGRLILNNKGNPVKKYEPYFMGDAGYDTEADLVEHGVTPVLHYDPLGRTIRVDQANGTFTRVEFSPWEQATGTNDTVLESRWYAERRLLLPGDPERRAAAPPPPSPAPPGQLTSI